MSIPEVSIKVLKTDGGTGKPLEGAEFTLKGETDSPLPEKPTRTVSLYSELKTVKRHFHHRSTP